MTFAKSRREVVEIDICVLLFILGSELVRKSLEVEIFSSYFLWRIGTWSISIVHVPFIMFYLHYMGSYYLDRNQEMLFQARRKLVNRDSND